MGVTSLLDTDLYKISMLQAVFHRFPDLVVEYEFRCRNNIIKDMSPEERQFLKDRIEKDIKHLCGLKFNKQQLKYLRSQNFISDSFIAFLKNFQLDASHVAITEENNDIKIKIKGLWLETILFEVPILSIVSHKEFRAAILVEGEKRLKQKIKLLDEYSAIAKTPLRISDFGTRRRYNKVWHKYVIEQIKGKPWFAGTSNVELAMEYNVPPVGTMAHEFIMAGQAIAGPELGQKFMLEAWTKEYRGALGIALTDTINMDAFLNDFDMFLSKLYDGCRHDSGNPVVWGEKLIAHYESMGINPMSKIAVFSDGLTAEEIVRIHKHFDGRILMAFGIGTNLTNDLGIEAMNIVIKPVEFNGRPVVKLSDSPGKTMCRSQKYIDYVKEIFGISQPSELTSEVEEEERGLKDFDRLMEDLNRDLI